MQGVRSRPFSLMAAISLLMTSQVAASSPTKSRTTSTVRVVVLISEALYLYVHACIFCVGVCTGNGETYPRVYVHMTVYVLVLVYIYTSI